jgi:hypothetical protein
MQQKNIVVEGKDGSEEPFPQSGEEVPSTGAGVQGGVHVELISQVVEEMPIMSNGVQEGVQVGLVSQVVEEMPGTSDGLLVGSVERDVVEGTQGSVASVEEDREKDKDISIDKIAAVDDSIYNLEEVNGFLD